MSTEDKLEQINMILTQISEDNSVPRNIRRVAVSAKEVLETGEGTPAVRASNALSMLDEISQDPNCTTHARIKIWNAVSILETIRD
ncbi:MAG: UPF0147 family protein [Candidatus Helarchaeota archaeon]